MPPGTYFWNTAQNSRSPCSFVGNGWNERNGAPERARQGSWMLVSNTAIKPITFGSGLTAGLARLQDIAFEQVHPTPGVGWTPTVYQDLITVSDTGGRAEFDGLYFYNIYRAASLYNTGRVRFGTIQGQVFDYFLFGNALQDMVYLGNIHLWPFLVSRQQRP